MNACRDARSVSPGMGCGAEANLLGNPTATLQYAAVAPDYEGHRRLHQFQRSRHSRVTSDAQHSKHQQDTDVKKVGQRVWEDADVDANPRLRAIAEKNEEKYVLVVHSLVMYH